MQNCTVRNEKIPDSMPENGDEIRTMIITHADNDQLRRWKWWILVDGDIMQEVVLSRQFSLRCPDIIGPFAKREHARKAIRVLRGWDVKRVAKKGGAA